MVSQTEGREGALPLLQFALTRIWDGLARDIPAAETLAKLGGVGGALANEAERLYEELTDADQRIARRAFLAQVQLGDGTQDSRRRAALEEIVARGEDRDHVLAVLRVFSRPGERLITLGGDPSRGAVTTELTHEALLEQWGKLRGWIAESRDDLRFLRRVTEVAEDWHGQGRPAGLLWRSPGLDLLCNFHLRNAADMTELQIEFLKASEWQHGRERRVRYAAMAAALGAVMVIALLAWTAYSVTIDTLIILQSEKAAAISQRIDQTIAEIERQVSWGTRSSSVTVEQNRSDYALLLQQVPAIERLVRLDANGREQLRLTRRDLVIGSGIDYSRNPRFTETVGKRVWISPTYLDDFQPFMTIGMAHSGRNTGVTIAEVKLTYLTDLISIGRIGKAGYVYVVSAGGRLLAHSDPSFIPGKIDVTNLPQVAAARGAMPSVSIGRDLKNHRVLTAFAPIARMDWFVFVEQPLYEALASLYDVMIRLASLIGVVLAVVCVLLLRNRLVSTRGQFKS
jgi:Novel STAND NTPase 1/Cache domain